MAKINTTNYQPVSAWNGTQDLFVVEQPDGTKVATPEQVKQYVLNDMDDVPTENSDDPVKSGGIFSAIEDIKAVKVTDTFSASPTRQHAYIITSGSTVDITSFVSSNDWQCWVFPVVPGDSFVITVEGGSAPRAYCFIDENGNVLSRAAASAHLTQALITAEKKGFCIIQNFVITVPNPSIVGTLAASNSAYAKIGDLSQTGLTGDSVAAQFADVDTALSKKTEYYYSVGAGASQTFNIEVEVNNRCYLFSAGYVGRSTLEFIAISSSGEISHVSLVNNNLTITAISFVKETGVVTITLSNNPYCHGRLTKLC